MLTKLGLDKLARGKALAMDGIPDVFASGVIGKNVYRRYVAPVLIDWVVGTPLPKAA